MLALMNVYLFRPDWWLCLVFIQTLGIGAPLQSQNVKVKENVLWAFSFVFILKSIIPCGIEIERAQSNGELFTTLRCLIKGEALING